MEPTMQRESDKKKKRKSIEKQLNGGEFIDVDYIRHFKKREKTHIRKWSH